MSQHALQCPFHQFYSETCYKAYSAVVTDHCPALMLKSRLVDSLRHPLAWVPQLKDHYIDEVILPAHVTYQPFDQMVLDELEAENNYTHILFSSWQGLIGLDIPRTGLDFTDHAPRRRVHQRQQGSPRTMDNDSDNSEFNFNWQNVYLHDSEFIAYFSVM